MGCNASRQLDPFVLTAEGHASRLGSWLEGGGDPNSIDATGRLGSLLHTAARENQATCIQILLARGASPQLVCGNHGTPLHSAAGAGAGAAARLLLAGGASAAALWEGRTPAELAAQSGHLRTAALLSKVAWGQLRFPGSPLPAASQEAADGGAVYEGQSSPTRALDPGDAGGSVAVAGTAGSSGSLAAAGRGSSVDDAGQPGSPQAVVATHQALCSSIASTGSEHSSGVGWLTPGWEEKPMPGCPGYAGALDWLATRKPVAAPEPLSVGMALLGGAAPQAQRIGLQAGGAQDAQQLAASIEAGCLPQLSDVTFEGCASGHSFDIGGRSADLPSSQLLSPAFSAAVAPDPLVEPAGAQQGPHAGQLPDTFLAVGLHSSLTSIPRPDLNLCILLDASGSMAAPFRSFYYGGCEPQPGVATLPGACPSKLEAAKDVVKALLRNLRPQDSVGLIIFNSGAATLRPLAPAGTADMADLMDGIDALCAAGSTDLQAGLDAAIGQLLADDSPCWEGEPAVTENRIVLLTDAAPNTGDLSERGLLSRMKAAAADHVHMTIVGVGLDFNTQLAVAISKVKGATYFSAHSPGELRQRLVDEFDCLMVPLAFDLELRLDSGGASQPHHPAGSAAAADSSASSSGGSGGSGSSECSHGWCIRRVYGSPDAERRRLAGGGTIARVHTLFPALHTEAGIKGGVLLLQLEPPAGMPAGGAPPLRLAVSCTDRAGKQVSCVHTIRVPDGQSLPGAQGGVFQSGGARKAVALARYCDAMHAWLAGEWEAAGQGSAPTPAALPAGAGALLALSSTASSPPAAGSTVPVQASLAGGNGVSHSRAAGASQAAAGTSAAAAFSVARALSTHASAVVGPAAGLGGAACGLDTLWARLMGQDWAASAVSVAAGSRPGLAPEGARQSPFLSTLQIAQQPAARPAGPWERHPRRLSVRTEARARLQRLRAYLAAECEALGPGSLQQELALIEHLLASAG